MNATLERPKVRARRVPVFIDGVKHWTCTLCRTPKLPGEFAVSNRSTSGLESWCNLCRAEYQASRREIRTQQAAARRAKDREAWGDGPERIPRLSDEELASRCRAVRGHAPAELFPRSSRDRPTSTVADWVADWRAGDISRSFVAEFLRGHKSFDGSIGEDD
jgi:hypothetical protein